ncbi:MAG: hypothetical protein WAU25_12565, partial [Nitrososphaeraceae archaeon]
DSFFRQGNCGCSSDTRTATGYNRNFLIFHLFYVVLALYIIDDTNTPVSVRYCAIIQSQTNQSLDILSMLLKYPETHESK